MLITCFSFIFLPCLILKVFTNVFEKILKYNNKTDSKILVIVIKSVSRVSSYSLSIESSNGEIESQLHKLNK